LSKRMTARSSAVHREHEDADCMQDVRAEVGQVKTERRLSIRPRGAIIRPRSCSPARNGSTNRSVPMPHPTLNRLLDRNPVCGLGQGV
jgi:hypothetical protein